MAINFAKRKLSKNFLDTKLDILNFFFKVYRYQKAKKKKNEDSKLNKKNVIVNVYVNFNYKIF